MRRNMMLIVVLGGFLGGCKGGGSSDPDVVASAEGQELKAERVAAILNSAKGIQLTPFATEFVANLWVDYTLFAQGVATGTIETDSTAVAEALWPGIANAISVRWHDTIVARRSKISDTELDSAYNADQARVIQHILIAVQDTAPAAVKAPARKKADSLLALVRSGGDFAALAREHSQDPGSAAQGGVYPPQPCSQWVPAFQASCASLAPGQISGIVTTDFGYHIIRRPTAAEAREQWRPFLVQSQVAAIDSAYFEDAVKKAKLQVDKDAVARMRAALADLDGKRDDKSVITTYEGGSLATSDFVRWVRALTAAPGEGQQRLEQFRAAPDSELTMFATKLTENALVLRDAEQNKVGLTADEWKKLQETYAAEIDSIKVMLEITPAVLDPKASESDRRKAAALKVDQFFDALVSGKKQVRTLPGMMAFALRGSKEFHINPAGTKRALDLATAKRGADSTAQGPMPQPGGVQMQPAPGPAPMPGQTPPRP